MSKPNALGRIVDGSSNPNWKGGPISKTCEVCSTNYSVKRTHAASRFCSMKCVGISQRKAVPQWTMSTLVCIECDHPFEVPKAHAHRHKRCSIVCQGRWRARQTAGEGNPNWRGGLSLQPYPYNFKLISRAIIARDCRCLNPTCAGTDQRLTTHHIDYDKSNCDPTNLITLCSACNSRANFGRQKWQQFYTALAREEF